jgi:hypothetical protein
MSLREFRLLQDFNSRDFTWLMIEALPAVVTM